MYSLKIFIILFVLLLLSACSQKEKLIFKKGNYSTKECKEELINGDHFSKKKKIDKIVISKQDREMYLYKNDEKLYTFRISLGKNPKGDKVKRGDRRTPIGSYSITRKICHSRYYRMIYISYPNTHDVKIARERGVSPGSGITIHAQPFWNDNGNGNNYTLSHDWTNGCIAITNNSMDILWYALKRGTSITIKE